MVKVKRIRDYESSEDMLIHHGIKGQKWGVRNGPPYPLREGDHSIAEKKAGGLGLSIAVDIAMLATYYGLMKLAVDAADKRRTKQYDEDYFQNRTIKTLSDAPRIDPKSMNMSSHMETINKDYSESGTTQNCMFCTTAMAMRMKGYDVSASKCPDGWSNENLKSTWDGYTVEKPKVKNTKALEKYLLSQGDGAYGNLVVYWALGGGHSVFYHVDNGQAKIYDTQANKERSLDDFNGAIRVTECEVVRLDNCEPTEMVLGAVKKREGKSK